MPIRRAALSIWLIFIVLFPSSLVAGAAPAAPAAAKAERGALLSNPNGPVLLRHDPRNLPTRVAARAAPGDYVSTPLSTFTINYMSAGTTLWGSYPCGAWPDAARSSFAYATGIWGSLVKSTVPITIDACWTGGLGAGILGGSATNAFASGFPGAPAANTWYPIALANALNGSDLDSAHSDMSIAYNSTYNWYFDTTGTPPSGYIDFASVVLHEVAHGLGFAGSLEIVGGQGRWGNVDGSPTGQPIAYDRLAVNGKGQSLINTTLFPNPSTQLATQLISESLYFDGAQAKAANAGSRPELYAPRYWAGGSSYAHLDISYNGTPNALMTYDVASQEVVHDPGPIGLAVLNDVGWTSKPTITSVSPTSGTVAATVTIGGTNLKGATSVKFGGISATSYTIDSAAQITATVPVGAATGPISVTTSLGTASSAASFTVTVPSISVGDATVAEGNSGTKTASFAVSLSGASAQTVTVAYATADGSATAPSDYASVTGTLTFTPSQTNKIVSVSVVGDTDYEPDETFYVNLSSPTNATIAHSQGLGTIVNDDAAPPTISGFSPTSGTVGTSVTITGTSLTGATGVGFNGTATTSYTVSSATQIAATVPGGASTGPIGITTAGGTATSAGSFSVYVPSLSVDDVSHDEGNLEITDYAFSVDLSAESAQTVTVGYQTVDSSATAPSDYTAVSGTLTFAPGETSKTITVPVVGDTAVEPDETFDVILHDAVNATIADSLGLGTIVNDDSPDAPTIASFEPTRAEPGQLVVVRGTNLGGVTEVRFNGTLASSFLVNGPDGVTATVPAGATSGRISVTTPNGTATSAASFSVLHQTISIGDVNVAEGNSGTTSAAFTLTLAYPAVSSVTVDFTTADGSATSGGDYEGASGSVVFPQGTSIQTITVSVIGDTTYEPDESFYVNLSNPTNATIADGQGLGTILDDDSPPPPTVAGFDPTSGPVGTSVTVTGTYFGGATSVTFGGTAASYTVDSATQITATVPIGAAAGPIAVTTAFGTATSAAAFTVTALTCPVGQFKVEYYPSITLSGSPDARCEAYPIYHDWGDRGPGAGVPNDAFSAHWIGAFSFGTAGTYSFRATADDGVLVWVDGALVIDKWLDQSPTTYRASVPLTAGSHTVEMAYYERAGGAFASLSWNLACPVGQVMAEYYNGVTPPVGGTVPVRSVCEAAPIVHDWGSGSPGTGVGVDGFAARYVGLVDFAAGDYTFTAVADDGVRVWVDGEWVLDKWQDQAPTTYRQLVSLSAGLHAIRMEYYEKAGGAVAKLAWPSAGTCAASQFCVEYFANKTLTAPATYSAVEATIDHVWGSGGPGNGIPNDGFSARWQGSFSFESASYTFVARADDGIRLRVDGALLIDQWKNQSPTTYTATKAMTAGEHEVIVEYYENTGGAVAQAGWSKASTRTEVIVDDKASGFTHGGSYWKDVAAGYLSHFYGTTSDGSKVDSWGEWRANLAGGSYEVFVYVPASNGYTTAANSTIKAKYTVYYSGGSATKTVSQSANLGKWVSLGTYTFASGTSRQVRLTDATGEPVNAKRLAFDAVKLTPR